MAIDDATVLHIASLAQLEVEPDALPALRAELDAIVAHVARLQEVPLAEAANAVVPAKGGSARPDAVSPSLPAEEAVGPAPESLASLFRVPRVLSG
jgi:aspartyl-tRNA(Asn)/glutamyl-tRNA(Gln) amidotransferase subunit C